MSKVLAKLRELELKRKAANIQGKAGHGNLGSQWGKMTSESKLIERGHFQKTGSKARQDYLRSQKRQGVSGTKLVLIKA